MRISVALATWNGERFLSDQLDSLLAQSQPPHEVVVSDDGSTDGTLAIVEDFRAAAPFPVSIRANPEPHGYANNFLQAATMCEGDFVAFCDQDDVWLKSKLARCRELLSTSGASLLIHRNVVVTEDLVPTRRRVPAFRRSFHASPLRVQPWFVPPGNAMVASRRTFDLNFSQRPRGVGHGDAPMTHDEWTYFIATAIGTTIFACDGLVWYRQHTANVFGAPVRTGLRHSMAPGDYGFLADRAAERSEFFEDLATSTSPERDQYRVAANHYRALASRLAARAELYSPAAGIGGRLQRFGGLVVAGGLQAPHAGWLRPAVVHQGCGRKCLRSLANLTLALSVVGSVPHV